jgi:hypothetical protein
MLLADKSGFVERMVWNTDTQCWNNEDIPNVEIIKTSLTLEQVVHIVTTEFLKG